MIKYFIPNFMQISNNFKLVLLTFFILFFGFVYLIFDCAKFNTINTNNKNSDFIINNIKYESYEEYNKIESEDSDKALKDNSSLININIADVNELITLPSIGNVTANLIIEYRKKYGKFTTIEQIKNVNRIGEKTFQKIKDKICID